MNNTTVTAPKGFLAAGISCGIKQSGKKDIGLICCPTGAKAAAVFTTNKVVSASVTICKQHIKTAVTEAVIVNSGNANTCTGTLGLKNAESICKATAELIDANANQVLIASTGIIGHQLPMDKISHGVILAAAKLSSSPNAGDDFAHAIMTTDTKCKQAYKSLKLGGAEIQLAGTTKGAGMIGPNMATTLCFITTDADISKNLLQTALKDAIGNSLNKLTVDGHQSTNDTAIILSSCLAGNKSIIKADANYKKFAKALDELMTDLAKQMALDAEGATRMFTIVINGAASKVEAIKAARAVADYDLVKCAIHGGDPNWGRIICAVGSCGVKLNTNKLSCSIGGVTVFKNGQPVKFDPKKVSKIISQKEHTIVVYLGAGKFSDFCYGCDLSKGYVTINADYHT
ncbi:MAG: bifunctional ornithine acetyltransferase/N-acetylglutamate synthase [Planctomycetes bacterium GWF2_42_9]|nr:MAG: bifunctional ornithine acetyltransferase/N-acetylglutamate synthase [Planctomycetes bacterium GWF2_42_9]HAL45333.1 ornithine acetyltransferase [Phycisphaerales bacterium]